MQAMSQEFLSYLPEHTAEALARPEFRTPEVCAALLDDAETLLAEGAETAPWLAEAAVRLAAAVSNRLFARACNLWSRTQKELGKDATAASAGLLARLYARDPHPDEPRRRPKRRRAEVLIAFGELDAAAAEIRQSLALSTHLGNRHQRGCAHADLGKLHAARGDFERAAQETLDALRHLDRRQDPESLQAAIYDLRLQIEHSRRVRSRFALLLKEIRVRRTRAGSVPWAQHLWLEAIVHQRCGRARRAAAILGQAYKQLLTLAADRDRALVGLDLVEVQVTTERIPRRARTIAEDLEALELEPEAASALAAWTQAVVAGEPLTGPGRRARAALANAAAPTTNLDALADRRLRDP